MRLKYKIGLVAVVVALAICLMTFQSYALWVTTWNGQENIVNVGCFKVEFHETEGSTIQLKNTYPISTHKALTTAKPYQFTITNKCSVASDYQVTLNTLQPSQISAGDVSLGDENNKQHYEAYDLKNKIRFALFKDADEKDENDTKILGTYATENENEHINKDTSQITSKLKDGEQLDQSIILASGTLNGGKPNGIDGENITYEGGESVTYYLYLWFDEQAGNEVMDKQFKASIIVLNTARYVPQPIEPTVPSEEEDSPLSPEGTPEVEGPTPEEQDSQNETGNP